MRRLLPVAMLVLVASCTPGPEPFVGLSEARDSKLQEVLDAAGQELELAGASIAVVDLNRDREWVGVTGLAKVETNEAWDRNHLTRIGSTTKTFTAALIFLLVEEGVISLDDPLEQWVPGYYEGEGVTLRHLLSNTSGIVSYNYVGSFDESATWEPHELADWAVLHGPELQFEPGTQWDYSNTNFVLLGIVIETATGNDYVNEVRSRFIEPLGLSDTYIAGAGDEDPDLVDCYESDGQNISKAADPSMGWAAGAGVSTPLDLARWTAALYGGEVLSDASLVQMTTQTELPDGTVVDYGLGSFAEVDGDLALYGHIGGIAGYQTYMYYWRNDRIAVVATTNTREAQVRDLAGYAWDVLLETTDGR